MRIGELAKAVGVSTRTIRYYHQIGLLPEVERTQAGYRSYGVRDLIRLSHARRLIDLGIPLHDVRQVLADEEGRQLVDIIESMDATLVLQIERLTEQRRRIGELRDRLRGGRLDIDDLPPPDLVEFFAALEASGAKGPMARLDRDMLAYLPSDQGTRWVMPLIPLMSDPAYAARVVQMYDDFDQLAGLAPDDPAVTALVEQYIELLPQASLDALADADLVAMTGKPILDAVFAELSPAQAAAAEGLLRRCQSLSARHRRTANENPNNPTKEQ